MKSFGERLDEIRDDPEKLKLAFKIVWIISYGMLMLGAFIIVAVIAMDRLF